MASRKTGFGLLPDLLGLLLRQGLVNPNEAVPFLMALQGDVDNSHIRSLALRLLMTEARNDPMLFANRSVLASSIRVPASYLLEEERLRSGNGSTWKSADLEVFDSVFRMHSQQSGSSGTGCSETSSFSLKWVAPIRATAGPG
jgi:hypothetical protein